MSVIRVNVYPDANGNYGHIGCYLDQLDAAYNQTQRTATWLLYRRTAGTSDIFTQADATTETLANKITESPENLYFQGLQWRYEYQLECRITLPTSTVILDTGGFYIEGKLTQIDNTTNSITFQLTELNEYADSGTVDYEAREALQTTYIWAGSDTLTSGSTTGPLNIIQNLSDVTTYIVSAVIQRYTTHAGWSYLVYPVDGEFYTDTTRPHSPLLSATSTQTSITVTIDKDPRDTVLNPRLGNPYYLLQAVNVATSQRVYSNLVYDTDNPGATTVTVTISGLTPSTEYRIVSASHIDGVWSDVNNPATLRIFTKGNGNAYIYTGSGGWKNATPYVYTGSGVWKQANVSTYMGNGVWK